MLWWTRWQLTSKDIAIRLKAIEKLGDSKNPRAVEPLIAALQDKNRSVRKRAAEALGKIGDKRTIEPLVTAVLVNGHAGPRAPGAHILYTDGDEVREAAAKALRQCLCITQVATY